MASKARLVGLVLALGAVSAGSVEARLRLPDVQLHHKMLLRGPQAAPLGNCWCSYLGPYIVPCGVGTSCQHTEILD